MSHFQLEIIHIFISFSVLNGAKNGHKIFSSIISTLDAFARKRVLSQLVTIGRSIWVLKAFSIVLSRSLKYVIELIMKLSFSQFQRLDSYTKSICAETLTSPKPFLQKKGS